MLDALLVDVYASVSVGLPCAKSKCVDDLRGSDINIELLTVAQKEPYLCCDEIASGR